MSVWWLVPLVPLVWGLGYAWACRAYVLGYERCKVDLLGDFS